MWISQKLFLDRKSVLELRHMNVSSIVGSLLESCSSSIKPSGLLETEESVSNSRIWGKINQSFFFWSRFYRTNGYSTQEAMLNSPTLRTLREPDVRFRDIYKNNFTEVDISEGLHWETPSLYHFHLIMRFPGHPCAIEKGRFDLEIGYYLTCRTDNAVQNTLSWCSFRGDVSSVIAGETVLPNDRYPIRVKTTWKRPQCR